LKSAVRAADSDLDRLMALLATRVHGHVSFVEEDELAVLDPGRALLGGALLRSSGPP